ncbi:hypothetical protein BHM03_00020865, partial [Ensete ventricosum]
GGAATCMLSACRGGWPWLGPLQWKLATARLPAGPTSHGLATCKGLPPVASPAASRGGGASRKGGCPLVGRQPTVKGNRRLCRGSGGDTVRVKEG